MNLRKLQTTLLKVQDKEIKVPASEYDLKRERLRKQFLNSDTKIILSIKEASTLTSQSLQDLVDDKVEFAYNNFIRTRK